MNYSFAGSSEEASYWKSLNNAQVQFEKEMEKLHESFLIHLETARQCADEARTLLLTQKTSLNDEILKVQMELAKLSQLVMSKSLGNFI